MAENDQIPSVRTLAKELGINPNTVANAYQELERNKVIYSLSGRGSFVAKINNSTIRNYILSDFDNAVYDALKSGITKPELINRINEV